MKRIYNDINLAERNSFGVIQHAKQLVEFETADDLGQYFAESHPEKWYVLGAGNNTLFMRDYEGVLLCPIGRGIELLREEADSVEVRVAAGECWDDFVAWCVERELWGVENLSAIPSSVGAAPVQNIGAYGAEVKDTITIVEYFDVETRRVVRRTNEECGFAYRESIFKGELRGRAIILAVEFRLGRSARPNLGYGDVLREVEARGGATLANIRSAISDIRSSKLPDPKVMGNAGSFFKNPILPRPQVEELKALYPTMPIYEVAGNPEVLKIATGWMIDSLGWKGKSLGRAGGHSKQALVLVNLGGATGSEVVALAERICKEVRDKFGVEISPEVNIL